MRQYEESLIGDVEEFILEAPPLRGSQQSNFFRGHANESWEIQPSLFRADLGLTEYDNWIDLANSRMLKFKQLAPADIRTLLTSELEWTATACHHHVPTPFSAWSEAALVGLYFATEETPEGSDGAVWRFMPGRDELTIYQDFEQIPDAVRVYFPQYRTEEMAAQRVCFLTHPLPEPGMPPVSFESYYNASDDRMNLCKIVVPHEAKRDIRKQLAALGFDSRTIYPGLKGIGRQLSEDIYNHSSSYDWVM